jgi:CRP-like cAMP-binding protein
VVSAWLGGEVSAALNRAHRTYDAPWPLNAPPRRGKLDVRILIGKSMYLLKHFAPGDILFRQGDPSDHVVRVRSGRADVLREVGEDLILLGTANEGEFLGEMGVLDERPRSATVRAASALEVELISRQSFLERVSGDPQLAQKLLVRMSARLRDVEDMLANLHAASAEAKARGRAAAKATPALRLEATTYAAMLYIGSEPIRITGLPYVVGRAGEIGEPPMARRPDLEIPDPKPYRLSRQHFCIMSEDDTVQLRDLNSELGTIVNEVPLGHDFAQDRIALRRGENVVMAGGRGSPYAFTVTLSS